MASGRPQLQRQRPDVPVELHRVELHRVQQPRVQPLRTPQSPLKIATSQEACPLAPRNSA